jgi:hypothetical protein
MTKRHDRNARRRYVYGIRKSVYGDNKDQTKEVCEEVISVLLKDDELNKMFRETRNNMKKICAEFVDKSIKDGQFSLPPRTVQ